MKVVLALALLAGPAMAGCFNDILPIGNLSWEDYVRDDQYSEWVLEVDHVQGQAPASGALSFAKNKMDSMVRKDSITFQVDDTIPGRATWSNSQILALASDHQDLNTRGDRVVTYVVYLDGEYGPNSDVLGVTFGYHTIAMFKERIAEQCNSFLALCSSSDRLEAERTVLTHELGHAIGLVNRGVPMVQPHEDPSNPGHSDNDDSIMTARVETGGIFGFNNIPDDFDSDDRRDICAAGGKGSC